jgi:ubiquinol-cytochrome c reductase cytochrome b subunit
VGDATLNRFFSFHVIAVPLVLLGLVVAHIIALHEVGSNNPDGVEIKKGPKGNRWSPTAPADGIPFHPYYTVKDMVGVAVFLIVFSAIVFFAPEMGGYFLEYNNFIPADPLKTPAHIAPVWYFTPYYSILRAMVWNFFWIDAKVWGVVAMGASTLIFFFLPWLDRSPVRSIRYRPTLHTYIYGLFVVAFLILGYLGTQPPSPVGEVVSQVCTVIYFGFFLGMPWWSRWGQFKPVPARLTM